MACGLRGLWLRLLLPGCAAFMLLHTADASADTPNYQRFNKAVVATHILPRYSLLVAQTIALDEKVAAACTGEAPLADLHGAYHAAFDAWIDIQHVGFGPVAQFMRAFRFEFWPDKRNVTEKQLRKLIAAGDVTSLPHEKFRSSSVAVQGLSAMERLLFGQGFREAREFGDTYYCGLLRAISDNMRRMAAEIDAAWAEGDERYADVMAVDDAGNAVYFDTQEATVDLLMSAIVLVEIVADRKLALPMGSTLERAKPRRAESWRSGRSLRNIRRNMAAFEALYDGTGEGGIAGLLYEAGTDATLDDEIQASLRQINALLAAIPDPLANAVSDPAYRMRLEEAVALLRVLRDLLTDRLAPALGLSIGFNSLDGD